MIQRKWINQPSMLQPYHNLHGMNVLYDTEDKRIYFLEGQQGNIVSQLIDPIALSDDWQYSPKGKIISP